MTSFHLFPLCIFPHEDTERRDGNRSGVFSDQDKKMGTTVKKKQNKIRQNKTNKNTSNRKVLCDESALGDCNSLLVHSDRLLLEISAVVLKYEIQDGDKEYFTRLWSL